MWNHFENEGERTTNHVESWHSKMNRRARVRHPNIFMFIHLLKNEQKENECARRMLDAGHPPPGSTKKMMKKNERLRKLKLKLTNNEIDLAEYMDYAVSFSPLR